MDGPPTLQMEQQPQQRQKLVLQNRPATTTIVVGEPQHAPTARHMLFMNRGPGTRTALVMKSASGTATASSHRLVPSSTQPAPPSVQVAHLASSQRPGAHVVAASPLRTYSGGTHQQQKRAAAIASTSSPTMTATAATSAANPPYSSSFGVRTLQSGVPTRRVIPVMSTAAVQSVSSASFPGVTRIVRLSNVVPTKGGEPLQVLSAAGTSILPGRAVAYIRQPEIVASRPSTSAVVHRSTTIPSVQGTRPTAVLRVPVSANWLKRRQNDDEELALQEAIAKEEILMNEPYRLPQHLHQPLPKQQVVRRRANVPLVRRIDQSTSFLASLKQSQISPLVPTADDTPDERTIKDTLEKLVSRVCTWDQHYGWHRGHVMRAQMEREMAKAAADAAAQRNEKYWQDATERFRRVVAQKRAQWTTEVEQDLGITAPWKQWPKKKHRGGSSAPKAPPANPEQPKVAINPADISLAMSPPPETRSTAAETDLRSPPRPPMVAAQLKESPEKKGDEKPSALRQLIAERRKEEIAATSSSSSSESDSDGEHMATKAADSTTGHNTTTVCEICKEPYRPRKLLVRCTTCIRAYHSACLRRSERKAAAADPTRWHCPECASRPATASSAHSSAEEEDEEPEEERLYCVCKRPYDDRLFYVGCDGCQDWFHPNCIGTTQQVVERLPRFFCTRCRARTAKGSATE